MFNTSDKIRLNSDIFPEDKLTQKNYQAGALNYPVLILDWEMEVVDSFVDSYHGQMVSVKILNDERVEPDTLVYFRVADCSLSKATKLKIEYTILGKQLKVQPLIDSNRQSRDVLMKERAKLRKSNDSKSKVMVENWKKVKKLDAELVELQKDTSAVTKVFVPKLGELVLDCKEEQIEQTIRRKIREFRASNRKLVSEEKIIAGSIKYEKIGGVLTKKGVIGEISHGFAVKVINEHKKPTSASDNFVGIEIECFGKKTIDDMKKEFIKAGLKRFVNITTDGSIRPTSAKPNGMEIRVCIMEKDLDTLLPKIFEVISNNEMTVNDSCGTHVHIDMRNRNPELAYYNLYKMQDLMFATQPATRRNSSYCRKNTISELSIDEFKNQDRYKAINTQSFSKHKTIEIRLHHGTVTLADMKNWINFLTKVVDLKYKLSTPVSTIDDLQGLDLVDKEVISHFKTKIRKNA